MNTPESLREFTSELIRQGLPADYAHRAAEEFADHHRDLAEELQVAGMEEATAAALASQRLGETSTLMKETVRAYQQLYWCGRWPVVTFLIGPIALLFAGWLATMLLLAGTGSLLESLNVALPESSRQLSVFGLTLLYSLVAWCVLVLPVFLVVYFSCSVIRSGLRKSWVAASALVLGLMAGGIRWGFQEQFNLEAIPANAEHPFFISFPHWTILSSPTAVFEWYVSSPQQLAQFVMPLLVAALLVWREKVRRDQQMLLAE